MIKNIIFDFGDVFINLDKEAPYRELLAKGITEISEDFMNVCKIYEIGKCSTDSFVNVFTAQFPKITNKEAVGIWYSILLDFPVHRFEFIKKISQSGQYRLFLLSNTNDLHISWIQNDWGLDLFTEFKNQFEQFYLSHEIQMRKPNSDIYNYVLSENKLRADETIFIDDTEENTEAAKKLGMHVWNINPKTEDIVELLTRKEFTI